MKTTNPDPHGRREFLKRAAVTGGAVTVAAAAGTAAVGADDPAAAPPVEPESESRGYRMTDHDDRAPRSPSLPGPHRMIPGEVFVEESELALNEGRATRRLTVANTGDRPVQVGSHYHFAETNPALSFERERARGYRLDVPAGTAVRFEPGQEREVALVAFAGRRHVIGFQGAVDGPVD